MQKPDFDFIIIGSGPTGVSAAYPLLDAGLRVLMVDGGRTPTIQPISIDFLTARSKDHDQYKWMLGHPSSTPKRIFYIFAVFDFNKIKHLA